MTKRKPRKNNARKNTPPRNRKKKTQKSNNKLKTINLILLILILTLVTTVLSYFFLLKKDTKELKSTKQVEIKKDLDLNNYTNKKIEKYFMDESNNVKYEEYTKEFDKEYIHKKEKHLEKKETKNEVSKTIKKESKKEKKSKLVIIIDDVTLQRQVDSILDIGYKVTMSFLPPTKQHPHSSKVAKGLPFYMIHFPMQAQSFKFEEENTLHVGDSYKEIEARVKELKQAYPDAVYTNNHTGSKFTSNEKSMDYLFKALKKHNLVFVDSRTTAKTVAKKYAKKYDMPYIARNIFIDNKKDFNYIQNQLKKAIRISKKSGYSIAIGHPYSITLKVLKESKPLLKDLELIYLSELPFLPKP